MCIVIAKPKTAKFPKREYIEQSAVSNPDGFAISWAYEGTLKRFTTMKKNDFLKMYDTIASLPADKVAMLIHARIMTHGSVSQKNCHCWVSDGVSFAHNGILQIKNRDDMTDSETFFRDIFLPIYKSAGWTAAKAAINAVIGSSKFAFLSANGKIRWFGYKEEVDGCFYSNQSYQKPKETTFNTFKFRDYDYYGYGLGGYKASGDKYKGIYDYGGYEPTATTMITEKRYEDKEKHDMEYSEMCELLSGCIDIKTTAWELYKTYGDMFPHLRFTDFSKFLEEEETLYPIEGEFEEI